MLVVLGTVSAAELLRELCNIAGDRFVPRLHAKLVDHQLLDLRHMQHVLTQEIL